MRIASEEARRLELAQLRSLEIASFVEATTLLLLIGVAAPLKHLAGVAYAVQVFGPIHGLVFLVYVWLVLQTISGGDWSVADATRLVVSAFVPLGGFINLPWLARRMERLR